MNLNDIRKITIAGAGIMGASMAQVFAQKGYPVEIYNRSPQGIDRCKALIAVNRETILNESYCTKEENEKVLNNITYTTAMASFGDTDFVIESIVEDMTIKQQFLKEVSHIVRQDTILTTNTSGMSITEIGKYIALPQRFAGFHWVNPPHVIPLVEVINGEKTAEDTMDIIFQLAKDIGKEPIHVKDVPGFALNRLQYAVLREALDMVEKGVVSKEDADKVFKYGLGIRYACLGPFEVADLGGLDTFYKVSNYLMKDLCNAKEVSPLLAQCNDNGWYGVKNGRGFYDYSDGKGEERLKERDDKYFKVVNTLYGEK